MSCFSYCAKKKKKMGEGAAQLSPNQRDNCNMRKANKGEGGRNNPRIKANMKIYCLLYVTRRHTGATKDPAKQQVTVATTAYFFLLPLHLYTSHFSDQLWQLESLHNTQRESNHTILKSTDWVALNVAAAFNWSDHFLHLVVQPNSLSLTFMLQVLLTGPWKDTWYNHSMKPAHGNLSCLAHLDKPVLLLLL